MTSPRQIFEADCGGVEAFVTRFSHEGQHLAAGLGDGTIRVFAAADGTELFHLGQFAKGQGDAQSSEARSLPITQLRWRPPRSIDAGNVRGQHVLVAASANGLLRHWHAASGRLLHETRLPEDEQVYGLDFAVDGLTWFVGGKSRVVRVFDEERRKEVQSLGLSAGGAGAGHSNRISSILAFPDVNLVASAGWDQMVMLWDLREAGDAGPVRKFMGPYVCGDGLSVDNSCSLLVTASHRADRQVQLWDVGTGKLLSSIDMNGDRQTNDAEDTPSKAVSMPYCCQLSPDAQTVVVGGMEQNANGLNDLVSFSRHDKDRKTQWLEVDECLCHRALPYAIYSMHRGGDGEKLALAGTDCKVHCFEAKKGRK